jgi:hypothetical protein
MNVSLAQNLVLVDSLKQNLKLHKKMNDPKDDELLK